MVCILRDAFKNPGRILLFLKKENYNYSIFRKEQMALHVLDVFSTAMYHNNLFGSWQTYRTLIEKKLIKEMCLGCAKSGKSRLLCLNIFVFVIPIKTDCTSIIHCIRAVVKDQRLKEYWEPIRDQEFERWRPGREPNPTPVCGINLTLPHLFTCDAFLIKMQQTFERKNDKRTAKLVVICVVVSLNGV